ncbi:SRPBCC family protein [Streptomyces sp. NPDC059070]|uniref:SRPBCC family protein n=1 Tax=Streptomyces sp. NPDC059070 TaxID=3346713 RepID=UPI0036BDF85E
MPDIHTTRARTATLLAVPLLLAASGTVAAPAGAATRPTGAVTCQGAGVDPGAAVRYRSERVIHAPLSTIWKLQTDVERYPSWQAGIETIERLDHGPFAAGSAFRWTTRAPATPTTPATTLTITSTVQQLKRHSCIRWTGPATGGGLLINGTHVWDFTAVKGGVRVRTEETHTGPQVDADVPAATKILGEGLEAWLSALKSTADARSARAGHPGTSRV